ncbi:hypothetical protein ACLOJK_031339 [Asimina triloba]
MAGLFCDVNSAPTLRLRMKRITRPEHRSDCLQDFVLACSSMREYGPVLGCCHAQWQGLVAYKPIWAFTKFHWAV